MAQAKKRIEDQTSREAGFQGPLNLRPLALTIVLKARAMLTAEGWVWGLADALAVISERVAREPGRAAYAAELRRREKLNRARVRQLRDGEEAPRLSPADLKALRAADAVEALAVPKKRGAPAIRAKAAQMRTAVGEAVAKRAETRRADLRLAQTVALDGEREGVAADQVLEVKRGARTKRLRTRDGLKLLHERGAFHPKVDGAAMPGLAGRIVADRLLAVGLRYRDRYEISQASLRSCLAVADKVKPSPTLWTQAKAAQRRTALANQVRVLEVAVAAECGPEAIEALRAVAGGARTINSITTSARRRDRLTKGLVAALTVVARVLDQRA